MTTPLLELHRFVIEQAPVLPLSRRARIYRELATVIGDETSAVELTAIAADLEAIERRSRQLLLNLGGQA